MESLVRTSCVIFVAIYLLAGAAGAPVVGTPENARGDGVTEVNFVDKILNLLNTAESQTNEMDNWTNAGPQGILPTFDRTNLPRNDCPTCVSDIYQIKYVK